MCIERRGKVNTNTIEKKGRRVREREGRDAERDTYRKGKRGRKGKPLHERTGRTE